MIRHRLPNHRRAAWVVPLLSCLALGACGVDDDDIVVVSEAQVEAIEVTPSQVSLVQGERFSVEVRLRMDDGSYRDPSRIELEASELVGWGASTVPPGSDAKIFVGVAVEPGQGSARFTEPGFGGVGNLAIDITPAEVAIVESAPVFDDDGQPRALFISGESHVLGAALVTPDGCPIPGGWEFIEVGGVQVTPGLDLGTPLPGAFDVPGCPVVEDPALYVPIEALVPQDPTDLEFGVSAGDARAGITIAVIEPRFVPEMATQGLSFDGTITTDNTGTCLPIPPEVFPLSGTLLHSASDGTRFLSDDGPVLQGSVDAQNRWTFIGERFDAGQGVTGVEVWEAAEFPLSRTEDGDFVVSFTDRPIRIDFSDGVQQCTRRATQDIEAVVPTIAFAYVWLP